MFHDGCGKSGVKMTVWVTLSSAGAEKSNICWIAPATPICYPCVQQAVRGGRPQNRPSGDHERLLFIGRPGVGADHNGKRARLPRSHNKRDPHPFSNPKRQSDLAEAIVGVRPGAVGGPGASGTCARLDCGSATKRGRHHQRCHNNHPDSGDCQCIICDNSRRHRQQSGD